MTDNGAETASAAAETLALKRALEWELSLDSRDLRSHAWYHGPIPRPRADEIVQKEGDFLIRDCVSQPGNFVLTCRSGTTATLHFMINKILIQPETVYERVQYQFEDDAYDTVPDLITFYVGSGKAISAASGARIQYPCNRAYPLSFYATKYGHKPAQPLPTSSSNSSFGISPLNSPSMVNATGFRFNPYNATAVQPQPHSLIGNHNSYRSPMSSPPRSKRDMPPKLPTKKQQRSQSLTPIQPPQLAEKYCSADGVCGARPSRPTDYHGGNHRGSHQQHHGTLVRSATDTRRLMMMGSSAEMCNSADGVIQTENGRNDDNKSTSADGIIANNIRMPLANSNTNGSHGHMSRVDHKFSTHSLSRMATSSSTHRLIQPRTGSLTRGDSLSSGTSRFDAAAVCERDETDSNTAGGASPPSPPPKPQRSGSIAHFQRTDSTATLHCSQQSSCRDLPAATENNGGSGALLSRVVSYHASGSDSGNGSGDSAQSSAAGDPLDGGGLLASGATGNGSGAMLSGLTSLPSAAAHRGGVHIKNPRFMPTSISSTTLKSYDADFDYVAVEQQLMEAAVPALQVPTQFDLENYDTLLLPATENRPLDNGALNTFRMMLSETGPRVLANHLTRVDIRLILELNNAGAERTTNGSDSSDGGNALNCATGIELVAMSHGNQFRVDLLERTECMRLLVAVTVLTCNCDEERAETLNKWIQVAVDTKTALGNLFGFCAIMLGLCMPQIQRLESAWHILRQRHTDSAFNFEAKLRPTLNYMNDCTNPQAPNTTVPHLLPYILLRDRSIEDLLSACSSTNANNSTSSSSTTPAPAASTLAACCVTPWETSAADFGIGIMASHLESIRHFTRNLPLYQRNAQTVMSDSASRLDELLEDAFRTEFHMKFLWGSKGAQAAAIDRHTKMEQLLTLMADKHFAGSKSSAASTTTTTAQSDDNNGTAV